jgi:hypothetical protein
MVAKNWKLKRSFRRVDNYCVMGMQVGMDPSNIQKMSESPFLLPSDSPPSFLSDMHQDACHPSLP